MTKIPKYDLPTLSFPYKIPHRLVILSVPRKQAAELLVPGYMPKFTRTGVRRSALSKRPISDRINDAALPYTRRLFLIKRGYRNRFPPERLETIDKYIEMANSTFYAKLANAVVDLRRQSDMNKESRKKRPWSEQEWKKHMDYISQIAGPKRVPDPEPIHREKVPLTELLPRLRQLASLPENKYYKRMSQENWYKDPTKVSPAAMKYVMSARMTELAKPKDYPPAD